MAWRTGWIIVIPTTELISCRNAVDGRGFLKFELKCQIKHLPIVLTHNATYHTSHLTLQASQIRHHTFNSKTINKSCITNHSTDYTSHTTHHTSHLWRQTFHSIPITNHGSRIKQHIAHHKLHITLKHSFYHGQEPSFSKQYHLLPIRNTSRGKDMPGLKTPVRKKETVNTHATTFRKY